MREVGWSEKYRQGVLDLLADVPYKHVIWSWQFEQSPFDRPFDPVVFVDDCDQVVGFNGVMPMVVSHYTDEMDALWSCDFFIAPDYRGQKLGSKIKASLHRKSSIIMALGVSDKASAVLDHLGWQRQRNPHNYKLVRVRRSLRDWLLSGMQWCNRLHGVVPHPNPSIECRLERQLPSAERVDELWRNSASDYGFAVNRNYRYLDWKYQKHPLARYDFVCAYNGTNLEGLFVVREHGNMLRIVDYCGPVGHVGLKRAMVRYCCEQWPQAGQITTMTSDLELGKALLSEGFFKQRTKPRFFIYSESEELRDGAAWFVMAGDSDGELLLAARESWRDINAENETT